MKPTDDQPTALPTRKWIAGFLAGVLGWIATAAATRYGIEIPPFITDAIPVLASLGAFYIAREWVPDNQIGEGS